MKLSLACLLIQAHIDAVYPAEAVLSKDLEIVSLRYEDGSGTKFLFQLAGEQHERFINLNPIASAIEVDMKPTAPIDTSGRDVLGLSLPAKPTRHVDLGIINAITNYDAHYNEKNMADSKDIGSRDGKTNVGWNDLTQ